MKKLLMVVAMMLAASPAVAGSYKSVKVCDGKLINASSVASGLTDCTVVDISGYRYFAFEAICDEPSGSDAPTYDLFFVAKGNNSSLAVPITTGTTALAVLLDDITAETWQPLEQIPFSVPPAFPLGTLRFLNNEDQADITCSAWLHMAE